MEPDTPSLSVESSIFLPPKFTYKTKPTYKYCIVPMCKNTTVSTPNKIFFNVPRTSEIRRKWCEIIGREETQLSESTSLYCCEDHFNLEEDTENYMEYKIMHNLEGKKLSLRLKKGAHPHILQWEKIEFDIEEHNVLDNPSIQDIFPNVTALKKELETYEEGLEHEIDVPTNSSDTIEFDYKIQVEDMLSSNQSNMNIEEDAKPESAAIVSCHVNNQLPPNTHTSESQSEQTDCYVTGKINLEKCCKPFQAIVQLDDLMPRLKNSKTYCKDCKILFPSLHTIRVHLYDVHAALPSLSYKSNTLKCQICARSFHSRRSLSQHLTKTHCKRRSWNKPSTKDEKTAKTQTPRHKSCNWNKTLSNPKDEMTSKTQSPKQKRRNWKRKLTNPKDEMTTKKQSPYALPSLSYKSNALKCQICARSFHSRRSLSQHLTKTHCKRRSWNKPSTKDEKTAKTQTPRYKSCNWKKILTNPKDEMTAKTQSPDHPCSDTKFICVHCNKQFTSQESLINHLYDELQSKNNVEDNSNEQLSSQSEITQILKATQDSKSSRNSKRILYYKCVLCSFYLKSLCGYRYHLKTNHKLNVKFDGISVKRILFDGECKMCHAVRSNKDNYNHHVKKHHFTTFHFVPKGNMEEEIFKIGTLQKLSDLINEKPKQNMSELQNKRVPKVVLTNVIDKDHVADLDDNTPYEYGLVTETKSRKHYKCNLCAGFFKCYDRYKHHISYFHKGATLSRPTSQKFDGKCKYCPTTCRTLQSYNRHMRQVHSNWEKGLDNIEREKSKSIETLRALKEDQSKQCSILLRNKACYRQSRVKLEASQGEEISFGLKGTLFKCIECDIHFLSAKTAVNHERHAVGNLNIWECTICSRSFDKNDKLIHEKQHLFCKDFKIYSLYSSELSTVLYGCPKCDVHLTEDIEIMSHYPICGLENLNTYYCEECDVVIDHTISHSHQESHKNEQSKDFTFIKSDVLSCKTDHFKYIISAKGVEKISLNKKMNSNAEITRLEKKQEFNDLLKLFYCKKCTCYLSIDDAASHKIHGVKKWICRSCGLQFPTNSTHLTLHEKFLYLTLQDLNIVDFETNKNIIPPLPEFIKCEVCEVHFLSETDHECCAGNYLTCHICEINLYDKDFKLHLYFHTYFKATLKNKKSKETISQAVLQSSESTSNLTTSQNTETELSTIIYTCRNCFVSVDTYDKVVEHCQEHYCPTGKEINADSCTICNIKIEHACYNDHRKLHSMSEKIFFNELKFDPCYFTSENKIWIHHVLGCLQQKQIDKILAKSIYGFECRIKMHVVQEGTTDITMYKCFKCQCFIDNTSLYRHAENSCFKLRTHPCSICGLPFMSSFARLEHEKIHQDHDTSGMSFRIVIFNRDGDEFCNALYSRTNYFLYQCRNCQGTVDRFQVSTHKCMTNELQKCLDCGLFLHTDDYLQHVRRHEELVKFNDTNIEVMLFGKKSQSLLSSKELNSSFKGSICDFKLYKCTKCQVCFERIISRHICPSLSCKSQCSICGLQFLASKLKFHQTILHRNGSDYVKEQMMLITFDFDCYVDLSGNVEKESGTNRESKIDQNCENIQKVVSEKTQNPISMDDVRTGNDSSMLSPEVSTHNDKVVNHPIIIRKISESVAYVIKNLASNKKMIEHTQSIGEKVPKDVEVMTHSPNENSQVNSDKSSQGVRKVSGSVAYVMKNTASNKKTIEHTQNNGEKVPKFVVKAMTHTPYENSQANSDKRSQVLRKVSGSVAYVMKNTASNKKTIEHTQNIGEKVPKVVVEAMTHTPNENSQTNSDERSQVVRKVSGSVTYVMKNTASNKKTIEHTQNIYEKVPKDVVEVMTHTPNENSQTNSDERSQVVRKVSGSVAYVMKNTASNKKTIEHTQNIGEKVPKDVVEVMTHTPNENQQLHSIKSSQSVRKVSGSVAYVINNIGSNKKNFKHTQNISEKVSKVVVEAKTHTSNENSLVNSDKRSQVIREVSGSVAYVIKNIASNKKTIKHTQKIGEKVPKDVVEFMTQTPIENQQLRSIKSSQGVWKVSGSVAYVTNNIASNKKTIEHTPNIGEKEVPKVVVEGMTHTPYENSQVNSDKRSQVVKKVSGSVAYVIKSTASNKKTIEHTQNIGEKVPKDVVETMTHTPNENLQVNSDKITHSVRKISGSVEYVIKHIATNEKTIEHTQNIGEKIPKDVVEIMTHTPNEKSQMNSDKITQSVEQSSSSKTKSELAILYKCTCGLHFLDESSIASHFKFCGPKIRTSRQKCSKCDLAFTPNILFRHFILHHGSKNKTYKYNIIDMDNKSKETRKQNIFYKCSKCKLYFVKEVEVNEHVETCEGIGKGGNLCNICNLMFDATSLASHDHIYDEHGRKYYQVIFVTPKYSSVSQDTSTEEKAVTSKPDVGIDFSLDLINCDKTIYKCRECGIHCINKPLMRLHLIDPKRKHGVSSNVLDKCKDCGLHFTASSLAQHVEFHHGKLKLKLEDFNVVDYLVTDV